MTSFDGASDPLVGVLLDPARTASLGPEQWNDVLWRARASALLARLAAALSDRGALDAAPPKARAQLRAAQVAVESSHTAVRFELNRVQRALAGVDAPLLLLKGAAYLVAELPFARGRLIGDLDVMVPRARLGDVERALVAAGWRARAISDYDDRYYREQSHELPPLEHPQRDTPVDVHHTIAPPRSRARPDVDALWSASVPLGDQRLRALAAADMVLHSAYHTFNDEVAHPLRDLFDVHDLVTHFSGEARFWPTLVARARLHGLARPLHYALRCTARMLGTTVPLNAVDELAPFAPPRATELVMDALFERRFSSRVVDGVRPPTMAAGVLYVRAHWLRMPPLPLARHLVIKAIARVRAPANEG